MCRPAGRFRSSATLAGLVSPGVSASRAARPRWRAATGAPASACVQSHHFLVPLPEPVSKSSLDARAAPRVPGGLLPAPGMRPEARRARPDGCAPAWRVRAGVRSPSAARSRQQSFWRPFCSFVLFWKDALSDLGQTQRGPRGSTTSLATGPGTKDALMALEDLGCGQDRAGEESQHLAGLQGRGGLATRRTAGTTWGTCAPSPAWAGRARAGRETPSGAEQCRVSASRGVPLPHCAQSSISGGSGVRGRSALDENIPRVPSE